jgi:hypothetical protein
MGRAVVVARWYFAVGFVNDNPLLYGAWAKGAVKPA